VIVPLAAAVQLHASAITLPNGSPQCVSNLGHGSITCGNSSTLPGGGDSALRIFPDRDRLEVYRRRYFQHRDEQRRRALHHVDRLSASGILSGPLSLGQILPLEYNLGLSDQGTSWNLEFELGTAGTPNLYGSQTFSGSQSGSGGPTVNNNILSGSPLVETVVLSTFGNPTAFPNGFLTLANPDFQFQGLSSAPEPASAGLLAAGLGFFAWLFRRRRARLAESPH
jgi:hypothetical protein